MEKEYYNINHQTVMMAILIHKNFPDEKVNGVAISKNLYRKNFGGFTINLQKGDENVVDAKNNILCEQLVLHNSNDISPINKKIVAEYISYSSINDNKPILNHKEMSNLFFAIEAIKKHYYRLKYSNMSYNDLGLDIEFKFDKNNFLYVKQVRLYL